MKSSSPVDANLPTEFAEPTVWRLILLRSAGFGAGFALICLVVLGYWFWYHTHPRPWDAKAITAEFATIDVSGTDHHLQLTYVLQNNTGGDYRLNDDRQVFIDLDLHKTRSLLGSHGLVRIATYPVFIPSGGRTTVDVELLVSTDLTPQSNAQGKERQQFQDQINKYAAANYGNLASLSLFDDTNRYRIDLPIPWANGKN